MTLRTRLTAAFLAVVLGPVLLSALFVGGLVTAVTEDRAAHRLDLAASTASGAVTSTCRQLRTVADLVARYPAGRRAALADELVSQGRLDAWQLRDAAGRATGSTGSAPTAGWTYCDRPEGARPGQQHAALAARAPLRDGDGAPAGEIRVARALDDAFVAELAEITGTGVTLRSADAAGPDTGPGTEVAPVGRGEDGRWVRPVATGPDQPLPLAVEVPREEHQQLYGVLIAAVAGTAGLALAAAWWLARSTTRPLAELARAADRVAEGDLDARVPVRTGDEAGQVAAAFNRMTHRTSAYVRALTASRDQLRGQLAVLGDTLSSTHDLRRILRVILQTAVTATGAAGGAVVLLDTRPGTLTGHRIDTGAEGNDPVPLTVPLVGSLLGTVATTGEASRGRVDPAGAGWHESEPPCHTYVAVPISAPAVPAPAAEDGDAEPAAGAATPPAVRGVLALYDRVGGDDFDDTDLVTLRTFAGQAAVAVDNVRMHEEAQRLSLTDPLTGLGNYRYLQDALYREVERAGRFGRMLTVLALDLDMFKEVNDVYGHPAGDAVLAEFARRIRSEIREVDSAFRQGGEEFVVLLPETDARGGVVVAQRLGAAVRDVAIVIRLRHAAEEVPIDITVSIGVAVYPDHGRAPDDLLDAADNALYAAKAAGRDTYRVATAAPTAAAAAAEASAAVPVRPRATDTVDHVRQGGGDRDAVAPAHDTDPAGGGAKPPRQSRGG